MFTRFALSVIAIYSFLVCLFVLSLRDFNSFAHRLQRSNADWPNRPDTPTSTKYNNFTKTPEIMLINKSYALGGNYHTFANRFSFNSGDKLWVFNAASIRYFRLLTNACDLCLVNSNFLWKWTICACFFVSFIYILIFHNFSPFAAAINEWSARSAEQKHWFALAEAEIIAREHWLLSMNV